jgi:Beta-galactosidase/Beta-galactosidase trimerisation domain
MKVLKIVLDKQPRYYRWESDRDYFHVGETVSGHVEFAPPGKRPPREARVIWTDSYGRLVRSGAGRWNPESGWLEFEFSPAGQVAMANYLEVKLGGKVQGRERFVVARPNRSWDDYVVFTWARYPYGYYDKLRELGVNGEIAYKRAPFDHVLENDFFCYVDQVCPDEMSVYHRPYSQFWEKPARPTRPGARDRWFLAHWDMIRQRYKRARTRLKDLSVARDPEGVKTLWRASCPSDRGVQAKMRERIMNTVIQHKNVRPMFYNLSDEAGTGDQGAPTDFCHCKHCLDRFRTWLEKSYGALPELNAQWDTDFRLWRDVVPLTTDDTLRGQRSKADFNFSSWSDHREFMDDVITEAYGMMRDFGREADPNALYATTGGQGPLAHGGFDYRKIARNVDLHVPYNIFGNDEMLRSFKPGILKMAPYFGDDPGLIRRMWFQLFHGDCGQIHWDNDEPRGRFLERPQAKPSKRGKLFAPVLRELTGGTGKQIMSMQSAGEHLALHHSQSSVRANWFMGTLAEGEKWIDRDSGNTENLEHDAIFHTRDSVIKLIGDCGLQYRFLAYDAVADGALATEGFKAFFMAHSLAVSAAECDRIRRFVESGGVVIADTLPAVMDQHCRMLPKGQLDDLFGVKRSAFAYNRPGAKIRVVRDGHLHLPGLSKGRLELRALEPTLKATKGAVACGQAGKADCLIVNKVGKGLAIYLNARLRGYVFNRYRLDTDRQLDPQRLLAACMAAAGISREVNIWTKSGERQLPGVDITRFVDGPVEMVGAVISPMRATSGVGEEGKVAFDRLEEAANITVEMPRKSHMYDSRTGKYHGCGTSFRDRFDPMDAKLYTLLPYEIKTLTARTIASARAGRDVRVRVELAAAGASPGRHVIRCDVFDPRGEWRSYYSKNVATEGGRGELTIPLAASDRAGRWRLELRDCVSGQRATVNIKVGAGRR